MLMNLKSGTEGLRAFLGKILFLMDVAHRDPDEAQRKKADHMSDLLLPVLKAYTADYTYTLIRDAIQILGGVGYCSEFPVEQYARDCKIISIWEGTAYIQSLDLVGRKLGLDGGKVFQSWIQGIMDMTNTYKEDPELAADFKRLFKAVGVAGEFAMKYMSYFQDGRMRLIPTTTTRFLDTMAEVEIARCLLDQALIARKKLAEVDPASSDGLYYTGKIAAAKYFCRNTLPGVFARQMAMQTEDTSLLDIPEAAF
jgi:hypothetical protein